MTKKWISETVERDLGFHSCLQGQINYLQALKDLYEEKGYEDLEIDIEFYGYDGGADFYLTGKRLETDKEYNSRLEKEKQQREKNKADKAGAKEKRKQQYEKLKKEFEN